MTVHPYGPLSDEEFQKAVDAPYGQAADILRKHDPMWGRFPQTGDKKRYKVILHQQVTMRAETYVDADTEAEAEAIAELIPEHELTFDTFVDADNGEIIEVIEQ